MSQAITFLMDTVEPNEQSWPWAQPILWTLQRGYAFSQQLSSVNPNRALWYLSLDGGITWSKPDLAHATTVNGESDFYWDGATKKINMMFLPLSFGMQSVVLQDFDLDAEAYSATYGAVGAPSSNIFSGVPRIFRMSDGSLMVFFSTSSAGLQLSTFFAIFSGGAWTIGATDIDGTVGMYEQIESIIPDPTNNLVHLFYSDSTGAGGFYYRTINSAGVRGGRQTLPAGWNLHIGNLNHGKSFGTGFLSGNTLTVPVLTRDPVSHIFSVAMVTGTPTSGPVFTISSAIDTGLSNVLGQDPAQAIAYKVGAITSILYFMGDGVNLYNLVKLAQNAGAGWSTAQIYDATLDPNAGKNAGNNQWLNAISGGPDGQGNFIFQVATWKTLPGEPFVNTATLSTQFAFPGPAPPPGGKLPKIEIGTVDVHGMGALGAGLYGGILYKLPDPKICKQPRQMKTQWQTDFTLPNLPPAPAVFQKRRR